MNKYHYTKVCFLCHGTGIKWTMTRLKRYLKDIKGKKARFKAVIELKDERNDAHCKLCHGKGVLIY